MTAATAALPAAIVLQPVLPWWLLVVLALLAAAASLVLLWRVRL